MRIRSIGAKLAIWYTGLLCLTFLLVGSVSYGLLAYSLSQDIDYALNGVAEVMVQQAQEGGGNYFQSDIDELFRRFFGFSPLDRQIDIFTPRGQLERQQRMRSHSLDIPMSSKALQAASQGASTFETVEVAEAYPLRVLTMPVIESGRVVHLVRVSLSLENMYKTRQRFLLIMGGVLPLALLLSGGGGWLLARRALRPVDKMTRIAQKISGEQVNTRLQVTGSGDELDRLAKTLNDMLDRLDDAIHQMRRFSADASHELQTPLTILKGEMEVALRHQRTPEEYQQVLVSGLEEIGRINHLVEGLLLLARADAGVLQLDLQQVDLKELSQEVFGNMQLIAEAHAVELVDDMQEAIYVHGDREHLRRLVLNLVDNGIKYTPAGGRVRISLGGDKNWATLSIADTGIGLTADQQQEIFGRFHRTSEARLRDGKGVGLGLNIALSIAEAHGGKITVASSPASGGSTFSFSLPAMFP
jgi:two-component system, OmpR family, sensor kinase